MRKIQRDVKDSKDVAISLPAANKSGQSFAFLTKLAQKIRVGPQDEPNFHLNISQKVQKEKYLVLDLDETLIHSSIFPPDYPALELKVLTNNVTSKFFVATRPGLVEFLDKMKNIYTIIIYTSSQKDYAEALIEEVGIKKYISRVMHREHCHKLHATFFLKDINKIGVPLDQLVFVDDSMIQIKNQLYNSLLITAFRGDTKDEELSRLIPFLEKLAELNDFRPVDQRCKDYFSGKDIKDDPIQNISKIPADLTGKVKALTIEEISHKQLDEDCGDDTIWSRVPIMKCTPSMPSRRLSIRANVSKISTTSEIKSTSFNTLSPSQMVTSDSHRSLAKKSQFHYGENSSEFSDGINEHENSELLIMPVTPSLQKRSPTVPSTVF